MPDSGSSSSQSFITLTLSPDPGFTLDFHRMRGSEALGRPFQFDIDATSKTAKPDLTSLSPTVLPGSGRPAARSA